jgi:hypothetical protein
MAVRRVSIAFFASGLMAIAIVSASAAGSTAKQGRIEVVAQTNHHALRGRTLHCTPGTARARLCVQVVQLAVHDTRAHRERCLEVWGGNAWARITALGGSVQLRLNRSNSCEIHRWDALARLLRGR